MVGLSENYLWVLYALNWASRVRGVFRRVQQPHLRGDGWFFDVPVRPGFYAGDGRTMLRRYQLRMAAPIVLEVVFWIAAVATGYAAWLVWAVIAIVPIIHLNHWYNVQAAEREARANAVIEETRPVAAVGLSLTPRRLRDFTNVWVEAGVWLGTLVAFAWLWRIYTGGNVGIKFAARHMFGLPVLYLYVQLGFLLAKQVIVSWRSPVPMAQTAEYLEARGAMRRYYLWTCDCNRVAATLGICIYAMSLGTPAAWYDALMKGWGGFWLGLCVCLGVWTEIKRKQLAEIGAKVKPVRMPDLSGFAAKASWPVCFEPSVPVLVLEGERGYSVNLANTAAYLALTYLAGMVALMMMTRM
jgi:hypothetical protein